jgi:hypothetical protein
MERFLSVIALSFGGVLNMQLRTYWHYGVHLGDGRTADQDFLFLDGLFIAICLWSWSSGFVLRLLSHCAVWTTGTLFCMMLFQAFPEYMVLAGHIAAAVFALSVMLAHIPMSPAPALTFSACGVASWPLGYMLIAALHKAATEY